MPEPDTFDLDAAFRALERDVTTLSTAPGAGAAVARARRRRRTTVGALAAAVALIVAGTAGGAYLHRQHDLEPTGLPPAATFDAASLSEAASGWAGDWADVTKADAKTLNDAAQPRCIDNMDSSDSTVEPTRSGSPILVSSGHEVATGVFGAWDPKSSDVAESSYAEATAAVDRCAAASADQTYTWNGAEGRSWTISGRDPSDTQHLWLAQQGSAIAMLWTGGPAGPVPDAVDERVMTALVAGLQAPGSYVDNGAFAGTSTSTSVTSPSEVTSETFGAPSEQQLTSAFGGWASGLTPAGTDSHLPETACSTSPASATRAGGTSVGGNGVESTYDFESPAAAESGLQQVVKGWQGCEKTDYTVTAVNVPGQGSVTVSSSTGAAAATSWAVQEGPFLVVLSVDGGSNPPESVSAVVGALLYDVLAHPQKQEKGRVDPHKIKQLHQDDPSSVTSSRAVAPRG